MKYLTIPALVTLVLALCIMSCNTSDPNKAADGLDVIERNTDHATSSTVVQKYTDTTYISAYSEIYSQTKLKTIPLTIMLSIRSGSFTDTTIINRITYYDTEGNIVKEYLKKPVLLKPMQSIDYIVPFPKATEGTVISRGGTGAHFIVDWGANQNTQPIMQCIMHGSHGSNSISFMAPGKSIATRNIK